jgi:hypothetical protein
MFRRRSQQLANSDAIQRIGAIGDRGDIQIPQNDYIAVLINRTLSEKNKHFLIALTEDDFTRTYALDKLHILVDADFVFCFFEDGRASQLMRRRSHAKCISVITTERKYLVSQIKGDNTACKVHAYAKENDDNTDIFDDEMVEKFLSRYSADPAASSEEPEPDNVKFSEASTASPATKGKAQKKVSRRAPAGCRR